MWKSFRYIFNQSDRFRFFILLLIMLFGSVMEMATLGAIPLYVGIILGSRAVTELPVIGGWMTGMAAMDRTQIALWGGGILALLFLMRTAYMMFSVWAQGHILGNRWLATSGRFFNAYLNAPYVVFRTRNSSTVIQNVLTESETLVTNVLDAFLNFVRNAIIVLTVFGLLFCYDPVVSTLAVISLAMVGGSVLALVNRRIRFWGMQEYEARLKAVRAVSEGSGICKEAAVLGRLEHFTGMLHHEMERQTGCWRKNSVLQKSLWPLMELVTLGVLLGTMAVLLLTGRGLEGAAPTLALLTVCLARLKGTLTEMMYFYARIRNTSGVVSEMARELEELETAMVEESVGEALSGEIDVKGVCFRYPDGDSDVLHDVSLQIRQGEAVAFVGRTGSGKSTMAELLLGLLSPNAGTMEVGGKSIHENLRGWRKQIGYVPQDIFLLDDSIRANVALGEKVVDETALERAMRAADIYDFVKELPQGAETVIGERGIRLSGGQRQRLGIARALYHNPPVLILDEATSALDNMTENAVVEAIGRLRGEHTVILVAHRLSTIRECPVIYYFENGKVEKFPGFEALTNAKPAFVK